ncbi:4-vinyl reductase 4VR [Candidatus Magnetoovum chiemensis]|nr:4-vinyl reductase 4VR [Candidatus Magnetoovum chiemensis]
MFKEEREETTFEWAMIGDINMGRPNLGPTMNVAVYRLLQFTIRDTLIRNFDAPTADKIFYEAGETAGREFCKVMVNKENDFSVFVKELQELLKNLKIGILRIEKADLEKKEFTVTVSEDLDCSGLPVCDETICTYDEGFLSGLLKEYTGIKFSVKEIDCWCSGDRVCRFEIKPSV